MKRPTLRHVNCPKVQVGDDWPLMAIDSDNCTVFVLAEDHTIIVVRQQYSCPDCGMTIILDDEWTGRR